MLKLLEYTNSQQLGLDLKEKKSWGIFYNSVRHTGGHCIAALRPPAVSIPKEIGHMRYIWNGERITDVFKLMGTSL